MPDVSETLLASTWVKRRVEAWTTAPNASELNEVLRRLGRWRSRLLANTYIAKEGPHVRAGPFAGMAYVARATEGALMPRLLGVYESELHPHLQALLAAGLDCVVDVGCAEGYYAVGLARVAPDIRVLAYDIDPAARAACAELAALNGVAARIEIRSAFQATDLEALAGRRVLVLMDVEGAEADLLQPAVNPALAGMNLIVETHDLYRPGALATLVERFTPTHDIVRVDQGPKAFEAPAWLQELPHLDQLLATWEWRMAPTPWLVMRPKAG